MSALIEESYQTGQTLYAVVRSAGQIWNTNTLAFENYASGHWTQYAIAMTEQVPTQYYSASYPSQITGVLTTECVYVQSGVSPATTDQMIGQGQSQGANILSISGSVQAALNLLASLLTIINGAVTSGTLSTTQMSTNLGSATNNYLNGRVIIWTSGVLLGQAAAITAYNGTTKVLTFTGVTNAPSAADTFIII